jgi:pyruvate,water dikinase
MWVHDLREADASCGGKAVGLARLITAGLDVPPGFVISDEVFKSVIGELATEATRGDTAQIGHLLAKAADAIMTAKIPAALEREVRERAGELGSLVAVRSSATIEDGLVGSAAGVFSSRRGVAVDEVWDAIRAVWTSALTPLAAAYARKRGGSIAIGVIVQEYVPGSPVVVYTRPPGQPESRQILIQRGDHVSRHARDDLPREIEAQHAALVALRVEQIVGGDTGVDVELVQIRKQSGFDVAIETSVVQARPIVHPAARPELVPPPPAVLASLQDGRRWTWDVAHNPDPLSVAQQGLVERVEAAGLAPWSSRVCSGFLYTASRGEPPPRTPTVRELQMRGVELEAQLEKTLNVEGDETLSVAEAIERYLAFYAVWARELAPLIAAARRALPAELTRLGHEPADAIAAEMIGTRESAVEATLLAAARGQLEEQDVERHLGCLAAAWDVCAPTFCEQPGLLRDAIARARAVLATLGARTEPEPSRLAAELTGEIKLARIAAELAERDDMLFARAQWLVRRALLARAAATGLAGDDVFWLPLDELASDKAIDPVDARRRAAGARAAAARAAQWRMPLVVGGEASSEGPALRGQGTGPRVAGRVVRFTSLASAIAVGAGDVVVTRAVTPALAVLVAGCAALVSETGGLLDHGAALARELGIPCVVGCRDAWSQLSDGMLVTVDGWGGAVTAVVTGVVYASSSE